jgi:hypothetical protein
LLVNSNPEIGAPATVITPPPLGEMIVLWSMITLPGWSLIVMK